MHVSTGCVTNRELEFRLRRYGNRAKAVAFHREHCVGPIRMSNCCR
ncbi:hypothetical protein RRSWK_05719 [Rhodopirellula sp. SWK7]|nr:hypothetical protein RRSWK_05719 [Rhodopirellula sp. SWK7]